MRIFKMIKNSTRVHSIHNHKRLSSEEDDKSECQCLT